MNANTNEQNSAWYVRAKNWAFPGWGPTDGGWVLTIGWLLLVEWVALQPSSDLSSLTKYDEFIGLKPSEMGDTLAGIFAVLAFVWIIVTVFLQSHELREQRREFHEQRLATQEMAKAMEAQAEIFKTEERHRKEAYSAAQANRLFLAMRSYLIASFKERTTIEEIGENSLEFLLMQQLPRELRSGKELESRETVNLLLLLSEALVAIHPYKNLEKMTLISESLFRVKDFLKGIVSLLEDADQASRIEYDYETIDIVASNFDRFVIEK